MMKHSFTIMVVLCILGGYAIAQTPEEISREANPEPVTEVDNSPKAQLWREMIAARSADNVGLYRTLRARYYQEYPNDFVKVPPSANEPFAVVPKQHPGNTPTWRENDITVYAGGLLTPTTTAVKRNPRLAVDSLGNKYAALMTTNGDSLLVFRSVDHGNSWTRIADLLPGEGTKWHSFDLFVTDSANTHKLGFAASRRVGEGPHGGEIYWLSMNSSGSGFWSQQVAARPAGRGFVNPAIVSDGYVKSTELTNWYMTYQNVDSSTGVGNAALAALSQTWGSSWLVATARGTFNDFDLDIDFTHGGDSIAVILTNDLTASNPNLRLRYVALSNFSGTWSQSNVASSSAPEFGSVFVTNHLTNERLVFYTITQSGQNNIEYTYSRTGYALPNWILARPLAVGSNNETRASAHSQAAEGRHRVAYVSSGPTRDTVIYMSSTDLGQGFSDRTVVNTDRDASTAIAPSVAGFRINANTFGDGVVYAGAGSTGVYYDGSAATAITVNAPNGGEILLVDSTFNITWSSVGVAGTLNISYSTNNGSSWITVAAAVADSPSVYAWTIPNTPTIQGLVRIRSVADTTISDQSDAPFTISTSPVHDIGVIALRVVSGGGPVAARSASKRGVSLHADVSSSFEASPAEFISPNELQPEIHLLSDTVVFDAVVRNFGMFVENSYSVGWSIDGTPRTPQANTGPLGIGETDTIRLTWFDATDGVHTARAWSVLAGDNNPTNDTSGPISFRVGHAPGDTLYTFIVPNQIILGVAKMGGSNKLAFTSGGQSSGVVEDNKWIITDLYGNILDTTHMQINPTAGQGFGFRDLAWDGTWLLTGDDARLRRIDTTTFTEVLPPVVTQTNPVRGIAVENPNRIWIANFTTNPIRIYDTTGAIVRTVGTPTVAPYGLGWDPWTSVGRAWLWYPQPSTAGTIRLSKVDTTTGTIVRTFDYTSMVPATHTVGGFEAVNDHPDYPGSVVGFMISQGFPASRVFAIYLGSDSSSAPPPPPPPPTPGWVPQVSGVVSQLYTVKAVTQDIAWAGGANGVVLKTTNNGFTWRNVGGGAIGAEEIYAIDALDTTTAFVTTSPSASYIFRTTDGGASWDTVFTQPGGFINGIDMVDASVGYAVGDPVGPWTVLKTTDGGATWSRLATEPAQAGSEAGWNNSFQVMDQHIWFGTSNSRVYRSTDGGATWSFATTPFTNSFELHFNNVDEGIVVGNGSARTTNGGATWIPMESPIPGSGNMYGASGSGDRDYWVGRGPVVYRSTDRGISWVTSYTGGNAIAHLDFWTAPSFGLEPNTRGWTVGGSGSISAFFGAVSGVKEIDGEGIPTAYALEQNYPNPFNPSTKITFSVPSSEQVVLKVYDLLGQEVATLVNERMNPGRYEASFDASKLASGVYFYRLTAGSFNQVKKMLLLK
jgi:photosystem II stability/assembly factor-like uncharacterized protein